MKKSVIECLPERGGQADNFFKIQAEYYLFTFFEAYYIVFCHMSMISLKRGSYSGSNGGVYLWIFRKGPKSGLLKEVRALNHLQEVQHITVDVVKSRFVTPLKSTMEPLNPLET